MHDIMIFIMGACFGVGFLVIGFLISNELRCIFKNESR